MSINGDDAIKSVERVFAVLSWFDARPVSAGATVIARTLDYPLSSTIAILKSMTVCGYLTFDPVKRQYFPTMRVASLGDWISTDGSAIDDLDALVEDLRAETGESVSLSCLNDLEMQFVRVDHGRQDYDLESTPGDCGPLFGSIIGLTTLSRRPDAEILKLLRRYNRRTWRAEAKADPARVMEHVRWIRHVGYGVGYDLYVPGAGAIAWALPPRKGAHAMVVAVGGPSERLKRDEREIVRRCGAIIARYRAQMH